jgi:EmrB/QacA subfamily drug resistance transporter
MHRPTTLAEMQAHYGPRFRWRFLFAVMTGSMAAIMSSTVVNVAIPDLSRHFGIGQEHVQWVTSGFMVAMTVSMLTTPWLLSRLGYRRTYVTMMCLLMGGGMVGGLSNNFDLVLLARVVEGLAAGAVQPIPAIIILRAFEPHEQGRANGIFGMCVVLAPALGPSIGGVLVDLFGWRSIFFMVVPFCLVSLWMAQRYVPVTGPGGVAAGPHSAALDWRGLLLATAATLGLLNGLVAWHNGAVTTALLLLGFSVANLAAFLAWQRHLGQGWQSGHGTQQGPLIYLGLFKHRPFAMGSVVAFIYGTALFGSTYLFPVYMQMGLGLSPSLVGTMLLPAGIVLAITIALVGRLADKKPAFLLVSTGLFLLSASFALMVTVNLGTSLWIITFWAIIGRIGLGFVLPSLSMGSMRGINKDLIAQGASTISFLRMVGGASGVSLCAIVLEWRLAVHGESLANTAITPARLAAFNEAFLMLAVVCALAVLAAWQIREKPAPTHSQTSR